MASISTTSPARRLEGKVAVITGGASGIGAATARLFCQHGAKVIVADIQDEPGLSLCHELGGPAFATFVHCDVSKEDDVSSAVDAAISAFGRLDVMFNNAGKVEPAKPLVDADAMDFDKTIAVNLRGAFLGAKHAARVMVPARSGSIIFMASIAAVVGGAATYGYTAAKHGILGIMKNAAVELGKYGVRANCVSPYGVATAMSREVTGMEKAECERAACKNANLKGRVLKAEDIALAALYLGSDESSYVSGHNLMVDGGVTVTNPLLSIFGN